MRIIYTYNILNLSEKKGKNEDRKQTSVWKEKNLANLYLINLEDFLNEEEERISLEKEEG